MSGTVAIDQDIEVLYGFEVFENTPGEWLIVEIDGDYAEAFDSEAEALAELDLMLIPTPAENFARGYNP